MRKCVLESYIRSLCRSSNLKSPVPHETPEAQTLSRGGVQGATDVRRFVNAVMWEIRGSKQFRWLAFQVESNTMSASAELSASLSTDLNLAL